jgi:hypothetical protein
MFKKPIAWTLAAVLFLTGCCHNPHDHGGEFVTEYKPGDTPDTTTAPYKATYALYQWSKPPDGPPPQTWVPEHEVTELYVRGLSRHDKIGFEKGDTGQIVAVAGSEKIPLDDGHYCWHITSETEYHGSDRILHETGENVLTVVELPFEAAGAAIALPFVVIFGAGLLCCLPFLAVAH